MEKSRGHIGFIGKWEYFVHQESGHLYRALRNNYVGINGYRVGARFESVGRHQEVFDYHKSLYDKEA